MPAPVGTPADIAFGAAFAALAVAGLATMARGFSAAPTPPRGNTRNVALPGQRGGNDKKPGRLSAAPGVVARVVDASPRWAVAVAEGPVMA